MKEEMVYVVLAQEQHREGNMDTVKQKLKNRRLFLKRDAKLAKRLKEDYIDNGIATLPCKVTGTDDIISRFSVPGYETLSPEFSDYIEASAGFIPPEYPIVLEISGCRFSEEEQTIIRRTIREDYTYELGAVQRENRKQLTVALLMFVGMLITGFLAFGVQGITDTAIEVIYIFFWFFADLVACYFFLDGFDNRKKRLLAGRLADLTVHFSEEYDDSAITDEEAQTVYEELEKMAEQDHEECEKASLT